MVVRFPLTLFQLWADSSCCLRRGKGWGGRGKGPLPAGLCPTPPEGFVHTGMRWCCGTPDYPDLSPRSPPVLFGSQSRRGADVHSSLGCPQPAPKTLLWLHTVSSLWPGMPKSRRWAGLLAMCEHSAPSRGICCLLPSCILAKGGPSTKPSYSSRHVKHSSPEHQPRSGF